VASLFLFFLGIVISGRIIQRSRCFHALEVSGLEAKVLGKLKDFSEDWFIRLNVCSQFSFGSWDYQVDCSCAVYFFFVCSMFFFFFFFCCCCLSQFNFRSVVALCVSVCVYCFCFGRGCLLFSGL
jgi:hypothetical protein